MMHEMGSTECVKVEIIMTAPDGTRTILECEDFYEFMVDKYEDPRYYPAGNYFTRVESRVARFIFTLENPRHYRIYRPATQTAIDDGNIVEEAGDGR